MLLARSKKSPANNNEPLVFQALSWYAEDVDMGTVLGEEMETLHYTIKVFGSTADGNTVSVTVKNFTPYFYVRVPDAWGKREVQLFKEFVVSTLGMSAGSLVSVKMMHRMDFWGFSNKKLFKFVRLCFKSVGSMRRVQYKFNYDVYIKGLQQKKIKLKVYEANIDPFIRFMHIKDIQPSGWICLPPKSYTRSTEILESICNIDVEVDWTKVEPFKCEDTAPFLVASFDIECTSSSGEFPVPKKDYRQLASQMYDAYKSYIEGLEDYKKKEAIKSSVMQAFKLSPRTYQEIHPLEFKAELTPQLRDKVVSSIDMFIDDMYTLLTGKYALSSGEKPTREKIVSNLAEMFNTVMKFPPLKGDSIIQIGTTFHKYGEKECSYKHIITLGSCDPIDGVDVETCETEQDLLMRWTSLMRETNPDIMTGYNIFGFDFLYMMERAKELGIDRQFMRLSRLAGRQCKFEEKKLSSSALGDNILRFIDMEGRVLVDLMKVVQRDHKLDSYKLDNVAHHFMGMNKNDVSPQDIFRLQKGTSADRKIVADYCVQDCALCNHLIMKLEIVANNMGMSNVCLVPLSFIFMRGQGIKIFSLVLKQCKEEGFMIPVVRPPKREDVEEEEEDSYEGAIVLEPNEGIYINDPVSVLDYASLYPSSMISENLSHDMIVLEPQFDNIPGVEYLDINYDIYEGVGDKKAKVGERVCRFVQPPNGEKGVIPNILMKLLKARKSTRKKMEMERVTLRDGSTYEGFYNSDTYTLVTLEGEAHSFEPDSIACVEDVYNEFQKAVMDGLQNAYKVTANSLYGQIGARTSPIYMKDIAACTTATGRNMIMLAKNYLEKNYNANIVYGDSVAAYTPVLIKETATNRIAIDTIENIGSKYGSAWLPCIEEGRQTKEAMNLTGIMAWTETGWTQIKRLIRHKLAPHKKLLRVQTSTGLADVTDDHSLLRGNGDIVKPTDIKPGDALLHMDLPCSEMIDVPASKYAMLSEHNVKIPGDILNAVDSTKRDYWLSMIRYGHITCVGDYLVYSSMNQSSAASVAALASSIGYTVTVSSRGVDCRVACSYDDLGSSSDMATMVSPISYTGYVYDFTTENHHFQAGIGRMIVHNTDSLFVVFPNTCFEATIDVSHDQVQALKGHSKIMPSINTAIKASNEIKQILKKPHDLEYEKTFWPFILLSKKRYVGNLYEMSDKKFKQKSMGIVLKRRDNANIVKRVYGGIIDTILNKQDVPASVSFLNTCLNELVEGKSPMDELIITKSLRSEYKDPTRIAHKVLAERIGERDPGNKPQVNDRIPYVYVQTPPPTDKKDKVLQGEKIEHPDFIKKNNLKPDYNFYITNQIMKPVLQLYSIIIEQLPGFNKPLNYYDKVIAKIKEDGTTDVRKIKDKLYQVKEMDVKEVLFDPVLSKLDNFKKKSTRIGKMVNKDMQEEEDAKETIGTDGKPLPKLPKPGLHETLKKPRKKKEPVEAKQETGEAGPSGDAQPAKKRATRKKVVPVPVVEEPVANASVAAATATATATAAATAAPEDPPKKARIPIRKRTNDIKETPN